MYPEHGSSYTHHLQDIGVPNAHFAAPDLDTFSRIYRLGLTENRQSIDAEYSIVECRVLEPELELFSVPVHHPSIGPGVMPLLFESERMGGVPKQIDPQLRAKYIRLVREHLE